MSDVSHTPGPWKMDRGWHTAVNAGKKHVAMVNFFKTPDATQCIDEEEHDANVSLIVAAPCMLARLESMAAQHACGCGHPACKRCKDDRMNQEVIARAKGDDL